MEIRKVYGLPVYPVTSMDDIVPEEGILVTHTTGRAWVVGGTSLVRVMAGVTKASDMINRARNLIEKSAVYSTRPMLDVVMTGKPPVVIGDVADNFDNYRVFRILISSANYVGYKEATSNLNVLWSTVIQYQHTPRSLYNEIVEVEADGPNEAIRNRQKKIIRRKLSHAMVHPIFADVKDIKMWDLSFCVTRHDGHTITASRIPYAHHYVHGGMMGWHPTNLTLANGSPSYDYITLGENLGFSCSVKGEAELRMSELADESGSTTVITDEEALDGAILADTDAASLALNLEILNSKTGTFVRKERTDQVGRVNSPAVWSLYAQFLMEDTSDTESYHLTIFGETVEETMIREKKVFDKENWDTITNIVV